MHVYSLSRRAFRGGAFLYCACSRYLLVSHCDVFGRHEVTTLDIPALFPKAAPPRVPAQGCTNLPRDATMSRSPSSIPE